MKVGDQHGFDYREGSATSGPGVCVPSEGPGAERAREFVPSLRDSVDLDSLSRHFRARLSHAAASRLDLGRLGRLIVCECLIAVCFYPLPHKGNHAYGTQT